MSQPTEITAPLASPAVMLVALGLMSLHLERAFPEDGPQTARHMEALELEDAARVGAVPAKYAVQSGHGENPHAVGVKYDLGGEYLVDASRRGWKRLAT